MSETIFWLAFGLVVYTYLAYPALVTMLASLRPNPVGKSAGAVPTVSIVIAAHNEAERLPARLANCWALQYPADHIEVIVVSDGSTDETEARLAEEAARQSDGRLRWAAFPERVGKAVALNRGVAMAAGEIVVFTDMRQRFHPAAVRELVANFADPFVGGVSGELVLIEPDGAVPHAAGLYWRYEKAVRKAEAWIDSVIGATGAIYAVRRALYEPLPAGTLLDDVLIPMRVILRGYRVAFDERAIAQDVASPALDVEFRRKVRTLAGNYQLVLLEPALLSWRWNPVWWEFVSHKLLRLLVPFALIAMFVTSAILGGESALYAALLTAQTVLYGLAAAGWAFAQRRGNRLLAVPLTFVMLNVAAIVGLIEFVRLQAGAEPHRLWTRSRTRVRRESSVGGD